MSEGHSAVPQYQEHPFEPIDYFIEPLRRGARRHGRSQQYFTKRAWNVVSAYIQAFTTKYDTVLDPFCGSGVTAVESLVLRRKAIASDLLPYATWITTMKSVSPVDLDEFKRAFDQVEAYCSTTIEGYYALPQEQIASLPLPHWYPTSPIPHWVDQHHVGTIDRIFNRRQLASLSLLWHAINDLVEASTLSRELLRFTFAGILARSSLTYSAPKRDYEGTYSGNSGIFTEFKYWLPKNPTDLNVWKSFKNRYQWVRNAKEETNALIGRFYDPGTCVIRTSSAEEIAEWLKEGSVDYVFADPPYGQNIAYNDLATLWEAWLGLPPAEANKEIIEGGSLNKTRGEYVARLATAIEAIYKVLRRNRWFSLVYVHKDPSLWNDVLSACKDAGFRYQNGVPQPTTLVSAKKVRNQLRTISGEMIINFIKPTRVAVAVPHDPVTLPTLENYMVREAKRVIMRELGADIDSINFHLVSKLLDLNGGVLGDRRMFEEARERTGDLPGFLAKYFAPGADGLWYLTPEAGPEKNLTLTENVIYFAFQRLQQGPATFDEVVYHVLSKLQNETWPATKDLHDLMQGVLDRLARQDAGKWVLKARTARQLVLPLEPVPPGERPRRPTKTRPPEEDDSEYDACLAQMTPEQRNAVQKFIGAVSVGSWVDLDDDTEGAEYDQD